MNNYKMLIQYDGGRYKGWQRLGGQENTVQGKIERVLSELFKKDIEIIGSSRTDAGVHALNQVANFKTNENFSTKEVKSYLNKYLPNDISVIDVSLAAENFHSRYNTSRKTYLYKIWNEEYSNPFLRKYSSHISQKLDISKMKRAAEYFIGEHDFTAFTNAKSKKKSMVREIYSIDIKKSEGLIQIRLIGNGFLHNMARKIVGILIDIGLDLAEIERIPEIINSKERKHVGRIAEASGLYLERIEY